MRTNSELMASRIMRASRTFLVCCAIDKAERIQLSLESSASCLWTSCGVEQAETRSALASTFCFKLIRQKRKNARTASKHSVAGSSSQLSCSRCSRSDSSAHSSRIFSFRCSASVCAACACGFSLDRCSIHCRAACSLLHGIPSALRRWTLLLLQFNCRESSKCVISLAGNVYSAIRFLVSRTAGQTESEGEVPVVRDDVVVAVGDSSAVGDAAPATATEAAVGGGLCNILAPLPHIPAHVINP